jgi:hypothetical protein
MSLHKHIEFAESHKIDIQHQFPVILTRLICTRSLICMEAMDSNVEFFDLAAKALHAELSNYAMTNPSMAGDSIVTPPSYKSSIINGEMKLPLRLLQSLCVVLSIWNNQNVSYESKNAIRNIADAMLHREENAIDDSKGLAGVILVGGGRSLISLENVSIHFVTIDRQNLWDISRRTYPHVHILSVLCSGLC